MKAAAAKLMPKESLNATLSWTADLIFMLVMYRCSLPYGRTLMP